MERNLSANSPFAIRVAIHTAPRLLPRRRVALASQRRSRSRAPALEYVRDFVAGFRDLVYCCFDFV